MFSSHFGLEHQSKTDLILLMRLFVRFFQTPLAFICSLKEQVVDPDEKPGGNKEQPRMMK